jgi:hypothetical protein
MHPIFSRRAWGLTILEPWRVQEAEGCIEITQPEGIGALHISGARKKAGHVQEDETLSELRSKIGEDTNIERAVLGDFAGYASEETDWHTNRFCKKWFLGYREHLLFVTYTCKQGDEGLELPQVTSLLTSLRLK